MTTDDKAAERYDRGMVPLERAGIGRLRRKLISEAAGNTLEIGVGTGVNLNLYQPGMTITGIDIEPRRLETAANKAKKNGRDLSTILTCANAQDLPFADHAFDTVVGSLVFCSIDQPGEALAEIKRVLKPDGRLLLLEHVRGQTPFTRRLTDWLNPLWFGLQGSCRLNRETAATIAAAGFQLDYISVHGRGLLQMIEARPAA